jgi:hypothetical protein
MKDFALILSLLALLYLVPVPFAAAGTNGILLPNHEFPRRHA